MCVPSFLILSFNINPTSSSSSQSCLEIQGGVVFFVDGPLTPQLISGWKSGKLAGKQTVIGQLQVAWSFWDPLKKMDTSKVLSLVSNFPEMQIANSYANPACQFEPWLTTREFESAALISTGTASVRWQPYDPTRGKTRAYTCDGDHSFGEFKSREEQQRRFA